MSVAQLCGPLSLSLHGVRAQASLALRLHGGGTESSPELAGDNTDGVEACSPPERSIYDAARHEQKCLMWHTRASYNAAYPTNAAIFGQVEADGANQWSRVALHALLTAEVRALHALLTAEVERQSTAPWSVCQRHSNRRPGPKRMAALMGSVSGSLFSGSLA